MKKLRIGIVGVGGNGTQFCRIYAKNPHCKIVVICDVREKRLAAVKDEFGVCRLTTDFHEVTEAADVDIVSIHTSDNFHAPVALDAIRNGKHIFVEKPMATSIEDCQEMVRRSKESLVLAVGMVLRTNPNFLALQRMVKAGFFGQIFCVEGTYHISELRDPGKQQALPQKYSRAFACSGTHTLDLMRWYAGEVIEVMAYANEDIALPGSNGYDEFMCALYRFENGAVGKLSATWADNYDCYPDYEIGIHGSKATFTRGNLYLASIPRKPIKFPWENFPGHPYDTEANTFIEAVLTGGKPVVDGQEGARTTVAVLCAVEAAKQGQPVTIPRI